MGGSWTGNLLSLFVFLLFQGAGVGFAFLLPMKESRWVKGLFGSLLGSVMFQWMPVLFAFFFGFSKFSHWVALAVVLAALFTAAWCRRKDIKRGVPLLFQGEKEHEKNHILRRHPFVIVMAAVFFFFCFLVLHSFRMDDSSVSSSQATYGDMNMHLGFITSLAEQETFPPMYSILPGTRLSYPFLSDSISSGFYVLGATLRFAYCVPMFFAAMQVFFGCYVFLLQVLQRKKWQTAFAWMLFFFNGGLGVFWFVGNGAEGFQRIFTDFYQTPTNLADQGIRWVNVIVDMMLPQRATLFGWAVLFPALYLLYRAVYQKQKPYYLYAGILAGALPMIHTHSFLAFAVVAGVWFFFSLLEKEGKLQISTLVGKWAILCGLLLFWMGKALLDHFGLRDAAFLLWCLLGAVGIFLAAFIVLLVSRIKKGEGKELLHTWGILFFSACVLALPQLLFWTFQQAGEGGFVRGHFGWIMGEENYLWYYLKNIGLTAVLALGGLFLSSSKTFMVYAPALFLWFAAELAVFQPNTYDNNKLLYPAFALLCCAAAQCAAAVLGKIRKKGLQRSAAAVLVCFCSVSAVLTMGREAVADYELYGRGALRLCGYIEENLPSDAVILTDTRHNNEIAALTGRNIVCGSSSYLFYHGLDYYDAQEAVEAMYTQPAEQKELFQTYHVDYVLVSDFERRSYPVDEASLDSMFKKVFDDGSRQLYAVSGKGETT